MKRICPRCNEPLFSNCYVKDKGINTLSYLELIIKKEQFQKENKEIKSCYCSKCGYVELYIDIDDSNKHHNNDDDLNHLKRTVQQYARDYKKKMEQKKQEDEQLQIQLQKQLLEQKLLKEKIKESKKSKRKKALRKRIILKKCLENKHFFIINQYLVK